MSKPHSSPALRRGALALVISVASLATARVEAQVCEAGTVQYQIGETEGGLDVIRLSSIAGLDCGGLRRLCVER